MQDVVEKKHVCRFVYSDFFDMSCISEYDSHQESSAWMGSLTQDSDF